MIIDYVFPYVNPLDESWQKDYKKVCEAEGIQCSTDDARFRDWGMLKYVFRSLAANMPWLNNVFILVHSKSQVPDWVNTDNVKIVEHKDFIDKSALPTFNSCAIEMFLGNIPELSENFIYGNDDFFAIQKLQEKDFFENGKPVTSYFKNSYTSNNYHICCKHGFDMIKKDYPATLIDTKEGEYCRPHHYMNPFIKSKCQAVFNRHKDEIMKSMTKFRKGRINFNQYIFFYDEILSGDYIDREVKGQYISLKCRSTIKFDSSAKMACINDNDYASINKKSEVVRLLESKFPNKCKYEM